MKRSWMTVFLMASILLWSFPTPWAKGVALNDDGRHLITLANQAFDKDMSGQPMVTDTTIRDYVAGVARKLVSAGKPLSPGVALQVTIVDSPKPMVYSYVGGQLIVSSGLVFGVDNEAQLAGVLAPQTAHLSEGYYLALYQEIKAAERRQQRMAVAGEIFGVLLDSAVDFTVQVQGIELSEALSNGEATYGETMKRLAALSAAQGAYYGLKDVVASMPATDAHGQAIDPRLQFEPIADAQGMILCAQAGYVPQECAQGWEAAQKINQALLKKEQQAMGAFAEQLRMQMNLMERNLQQLHRQLGDSGLLQTPGYFQPSKAPFAADLTRMKEVQDAVSGRTMKDGRLEYMAFLSAALAPRAQAALAEERYDDAHQDYIRLYAHGVRTAEVLYGMAKSELGDFAFGASPAALERAEAAYREASRLDPHYALPYRGLAELYSDTDEFEAAADAWRTYLKLAPDAPDRSKINRKIKILEKKAKR